MTATTGTRLAGRAASTRTALLDSARTVFTSSGFAEASIADVVAGAGASVGSLYHHFGGKAELYLALFEDYQQRQEARAAAAVREARTTGETDPVALFVAGSRAYLGGCWAERDLARLFLAGGGPPGFELVARRRYREWTARNVELKRALPGQATLRSVRAGQHADFDRVVFEFEGARLPGYHLSYIDKPVILCGSGDPTPVEGQGWLQVRFSPARAHNDEGQLTVDKLELKPRLPVLLEVERTCDFEGEVTWVLGNKSPNKFRVMELKDPTRLVVDVQH